MTRGFRSSAIVLLLAAVPVFGQIVIPGVGGYPGQRYPQGGQGGPAQGRRGADTDRGATTLTGVLRKIGENNLIIESEDRKITTVARANSTKYLSASGGSAKIGDFQPGDRVSISAKQDNNSAYRATAMTMVREGTPEEHSIASVAADDTSRPLPGGSSDNSSVNSAGNNSSGNSAGNSSKSSSAASSTGSAGNDDPDRPRLRRPASSSDGSAPAQTPKAQITQGDVDNDDPPQLRRRPPDDSDGATADRRPSLHADDVDGATRMPSPPRRMPATGDPFIEQAREAAFTFSETLPNYVVKQYTTRYATAVARGGKTSWQVRDNVTADVIEEDGNEKYKNILVNGRPPVEDVEKTGSWTRGEFSSLLQDVLSPVTDADFHGKRSTTIVNRPAFRYDFSVMQPNSHWHIEAESQSCMPAYTGAIWIDKENYRVLRIEMSAQSMPRAFPLDQVESAVDYDYVLIGESKYLLPVHSEALSCARGTNQCTRNVIEFRNYKKFTADTSITFDADK